jgi:protein SCO1/2
MWYQNKLAPLPYYGKNFSVEQESSNNTRILPFDFIDQDSAALNNNFVIGHISVIHFFFTSCPTICPQMMVNLAAVHNKFKGNENLRIVSLTVDPAHDTPSRLKKYASIKKIDTQYWKLATADKTSLYLFARKGLYLDATDGDGGPSDFIHSEKLVLIDPDQHIRGYYDGTDKSDVEKLEDDIGRLMAKQNELIK